MSNKVTVQGESRVTIVEQSSANLTVSSPNQPSVVEVVTRGPQGTGAALGQLSDINVTSAVNGSTLVYNSSTGEWVGNDNTTVAEIVNGGNF